MADPIALPSVRESDQDAARQRARATILHARSVIGCARQLMDEVHAALGEMTLAELGAQIDSISGDPATKTSLRKLVKRCRRTLEVVAPSLDLPDLSAVEQD